MTLQHYFNEPKVHQTPSSLRFIIIRGKLEEVKRSINLPTRTIKLPNVVYQLIGKCVSILSHMDQVGNS